MIPDEKYDLVRQLIQRQFDSDSEVYLTLSIDGVVTNLTVITEKPVDWNKDDYTEDAYDCLNAMAFDNELIKKKLTPKYKEEKNPSLNSLINTARLRDSLEEAELEPAIIDRIIRTAEEHLVIQYTLTSLTKEVRQEMERILHVCLNLDELTLKDLKHSYTLSSILSKTNFSNISVGKYERRTPKDISRLFTELNLWNVAEKVFAGPNYQNLRNNFRKAAFLQDENDIYEAVKVYPDLFTKLALEDSGRLITETLSEGLGRANYTTFANYYIVARN
ncbi:hypothetical protein [Streptococcus salivarius]|jgi:hypothetical protein|uniref:hypothetical protein n=1 Tax=Streptococcus salivarius TaxID=1304 RepID=UPI0007E3C76B|nr:hypothetical protein [Streptococcus salivarius]